MIFSGVDEQRWNEPRPLVIITTSPPPTTLESVFIYFDTLPPPPRRITRPTQRKTCLLSVVANFSEPPPIRVFFPFLLLFAIRHSVVVVVRHSLLPIFSSPPACIYTYPYVDSLPVRLSLCLSPCLSASLHLVVSNVSFFILICLSPDDDDFFSSLLHTEYR